MRRSAEVPWVYKDAKDAWYFKASTHKDPLTGKWAQVTRRGFPTAAEAATAREDLIREAEKQPKATVSGLTVRQLVEQYLDECEASERLGTKSLFDHRHYLDDYIEPWIGSLRVRELTADVVASWQHKLAIEGSKKTDRGLAPNTIRLARAPLNGAQAGGGHGGAAGQFAGVGASSEAAAVDPEALVARRVSPVPRAARG